MKKYIILSIFLLVLNILGIYTRKSFVINISSSIPVGIYKLKEEILLHFQQRNIRIY